MTGAIRWTMGMAAILVVVLVGRKLGVMIDSVPPIATWSAESKLATPESPEAGTIPRGSAQPGWPCLFGPFHNGVSAESDLHLSWPASGPREKWRRLVGRGYSAPVLWGDRGVIHYRDGNEEIVECFDAASGESRWKFRYPTAYVCRYAYSDGPYATPALEEGRVYSLGAEGQLHCLDLADGHELWHRSLMADYQVKPGMFAVGGSPLLEGDRLILNVGGEQPGTGIVAIDKRTGKTLWCATDDGAGYATACAATIHGQRYVFVFTHQGLVALDPGSGRVWWTIPFCADNPEKENATSPLVFGDCVLVSAFCKGCLCVRVLPDGTCRELWRGRQAFCSQYDNLVCAEGYVYGFASVDNSLRCVEMTTGRVQWKWKSRTGSGALLRVDDSLLFWTERGRLGAMAVNPQEPVLLSLTERALLPPPCFTAPALYRGRLYLRTEGTLLCLDLRKPRPSDVEEDAFQGSAKMR